MRKPAYQNYESTTTWNTNLNIGDKLEGEFISQEEFEGNFGHTIKYVVKSQDGTLYGVYGSASLNKQFNKIPVGSYIWIEYTGETTSQNGRIVKTYKVEYDDEYNK